MFYKHWKKISLALTAFFWASCNNTTVTEPPLYGVPPDISSSSESPESSAIESSSSETTQNLSLSSEAQSSSSELTQVMPAYGVYDKVSCYLDDKETKMSNRVTEYTYHCENGVNCVERDSVTGYEPEYPCKEVLDENGVRLQTVCLDYGVIATTETTISCDDGETYNVEEFRKQYNRLYTIKNNQDESSSSTAESSSSDEVTCYPSSQKRFYLNRTDRYSIDRARSAASDQAKSDFARNANSIINDSLSESSKKCINDMLNALERNFAAAYGAPYSNSYPAEEICSDGTTRPTKEYLEQQAFDEEQAKKKPQYDAAYAESYEKVTQNLNKRVEKCLKSDDKTTKSE